MALLLKSNLPSPCKKHYTQCKLMTILSLNYFSCQPFKNTVSFNDHLSHPAAWFTRAVLGNCFLRVCMKVLKPSLTHSQISQDTYEYFYYHVCPNNIARKMLSISSTADMRKDDIPSPKWDSAAGPLHYRKGKCSHSSVSH